MNASTNKYQITKAIRFKLEPNSVSLINKPTNTGNEFSLSTFLCVLDDYLSRCNDFLFVKQKKTEKFVINNKLTIKNEWLRTFQKQECADLRAKKQASLDYRRTPITIGDIPYLASKIETIFDEIDDIYADLSSDASAALNERAKRARTALLLKRLNTKQALPYLMSLIENVSDKNESGKLSLELKSRGIKLNDLLTLGIQEYLPEQSGGLPIAKASFNYYTINKKPVDYVRKIRELESSLSFDLEKLFDLENNKKKKIFNLENIKNKIKEDVQRRLNGKKLLIGDAPMIEVDDYVSLRQTLKNIKTEQKKAFSEFMQTKPSFEELKERSDLYLFNNISQNEFDKYASLTQKIEEKAAEYNPSTNENDKEKLKSKLQDLKKERGALINAADSSTRGLFQTYKGFAEAYGKIAQQHGRILAQLKGIEKERIESQLLNYWAMILVENKQYKIVLIPQEKANECKKQVEKSRGVGDSAELYWFESFTFRSLRKLCFGNVENRTNSNTFYPEISKELWQKYYTTDNNDNKKFIKTEADFRGDEQKKINFYKDVLCTKYASEVLTLPWKQVDEDIIKPDFASLDEFIIALEKICYSRFVVIDKNMINELSKYDAQIFDIESLDLNSQQNTQNKDVRYLHNDKKHTEIWKYFWSKDNEHINYETRLNPEITITYRKPKQSRIDKYGESSDRYDEKKKNRYLHEQYTLVTTVSENSNSYAKDLSFISDDEYKEAITKFNDKLQIENIKFSIGIDNGEAELSTLGIYLPQFNKATDDERIAELQKVSEYGFKTLTITNLKYSECDINGRKRMIFQNPSYFLNKDLYCRTFKKTEDEYNKMFGELFEEKHSLTLDLTTAKMINGQIITNGDVQTYLNLWLRIAQRKIYELNDHIKEKTAKEIMLKRRADLEEKEKAMFVDSIYESTKKYIELDDKKKMAFANWLFQTWDGVAIENAEFEAIKKEQKRDRSTYKENDIFAVSHIDKKIDVKNVFKYRNNFRGLKDINDIISEIGKYNIRTISDEELDLNITNLKMAIVGNVVGVIDFLYNSYTKRFDGDGIIVKEGFDIAKVENDMNRFSGNIYRILERKLYQKFQNYGLVPPIKDLLLIREKGVSDKEAIMYFGIIGFVSQAGTSQNCPICCTKRSLSHTTKCSKCGFDLTNIMHSNDGIAGYNIAKRGFENLTRQQPQ